MGRQTRLKMRTLDTERCKKIIFVYIIIIIIIIIITIIISSS